MLALLTNRWLAGILAAFALCAGMWIAGDVHGHKASNAKIATLQASYAETLAKYETQARAKEQAQAATIAQIDAQHAQEMKDAQAAADRTIADLRAGTLKLRKRWTCPRVPEVAASPGKSDAAADDRAASAARIVRAADEADATIRALQEILRAERQ